MIRGEEERVKLQNETEERTGFDFSVLRKILVVEERMSSLLPLELFELVLSYSKFNPLWRAAQKRAVVTLAEGDTIEIFNPSR